MCRDRDVDGGVVVTDRSLFKLDLPTAGTPLAD